MVGAGPAGSLAAYRLASRGASVLLLDRARFPRDKPCGGGVTGRAARLVPFPLDPVVEDVATRAELRLGYGPALERGGKAALILMTQRARLDEYLARRAAEAGAEFRDGVRVRGVEPEEEGIAVAAAGERFSTAALVGADGVNGLVGRTLGLGGNRLHGVALEGNMPYGRLARERFRGRFLVELGVVPGGYGWVFPKAGHANFGVGGWEREGPRLREHLRRLCEAHGARFDELESLRGYRLPVRSPRSVLARGRALLVGDAAGLVDPVSGDGMYEAFLSAQLAADAVCDLLGGRSSSVEPYDSRLEATLSRSHRVSWLVKGALDRFPRPVFALTGTRPVWTALEALLTGRARL